MKYTTQTFLDGKVTLYGGDNRDVLRDLPDNSIDSIVTDPPYALVSIVKRFGSANAKPANDNDVYSRSSRGFMGKQWDTGEVAFSEVFWAECLRVLKPGGHVAAFSGTRTYHRMACAIEDAGFEIRDQLAWCYGSGFAKSHAVDLGLWNGVLNCQSKDSAPLVVQVSAFIHLSCEGAKEHIVAAPALILPEARPALIIQTGKAGASSEVTVMLLSASEAESISLSTGWLWEKNLVESSDPRSMYTTETKSRQITTTKIWKSLTLLTTQKSTLADSTLQNGWTWPAVVAVSDSSGENTSKSATPILTALEDVTWNPVARAKGIGTGLKPSWEPICLGRKPLIGTVAENVLKHGTGAINVDGCRVGTEGGTAKGRSTDKSQTDSVGGYLNANAGTPIDAGRWPANIIHDGSDEVVAAFPQIKTSRSTVTSKPGSVYGNGAGLPSHTGIYGADETGSAARFFYAAKADKQDRMGSKHPTVKPVDLMQWLCRLITPSGGTVLDPFAGSGSTGEAAWREGFKAVLCEREEEYQADIAERLRLASAGPMERSARAIKQVDSLGPLFGDNDNEPAGGGQTDIRKVRGSIAGVSGQSDSSGEAVV